MDIAVASDLHELVALTVELPSLEGLLGLLLEVLALRLPFGPELAALFLIGADYTRQHIRYQRPGNLVQANRMLFGFLGNSHYTAILQKSDLELSFVPKDDAMDFYPVTLCFPTKASSLWQNDFEKLASSTATISLLADRYSSKNERAASRLLKISR